MGKTLRQFKQDRQLALFGGGQDPEGRPGREKKEASRLRPTPENCCGKPMIPCWFREKFKGYVCWTGTPMHWLGVRQLAKIGYFRGRKQRDRTKLAKLLREDS